VLPTDERPQEIDARFRLEGERIAGGMGMVYRGVDLETGNPVAVKISSAFGSQLGERFQQEANCLATIAHPAIVRYIAHGKTIRGEHYLVMEWLEGETLEDRLGRGPIRLGAAVMMIRRVAEALFAAHERGVIHRDIKPANIFLPDKDLARIKLLDFGIARRLFDPAALRLTQAGSALGTPMYMSPEQAQGSLEVDVRADIFSLGCVFFECLTGTPPFMADSTTGTLARVANDEDIDVDGKCRGVPPRLTNLLRRMLAKRAQGRPATMVEVLSELGQVTTELRGTGAYPGDNRRRRSPSDAALLVATGEHRLIAVIVLSPKAAAVARPPKVDRHATADLGNLLARNLSDDEFDDTRLDMLSAEIAPFGARIRRLANDSLVVTLAGESRATPLDLAVRAARCALKLKQGRPGSSMGISIGHAVKEAELRTEHLVNSAVRLVTKQHAGSIHVSDEIKRLLEGRFEIVAEPDGRARLLFEKGLREAPRTVLGKEIPCIGREREVRELEGLFETCIEDETAQVVLMSGSAGCGKSRVAYEFLERTRDSGQSFELLIGRGDPTRFNVSLGLIGQALRAVAGITGTEPDDVRRKRLVAHASRFLPSKSAANTVAFLGEIANVRFPDDDLPQLQAARRDARLMADQTMTAWVDWLEAEAEHHPVLLLFEDLHWGDFASINYVDNALRVLRKKPFMVLALARPEVDDQYVGIWRDRHPQRMSLMPLGNRAGQQFIKTVLGDIEPDKVSWLLDHAQGNPFYLEELVRVVAMGGDLGQLPSSVLGTVQIRFDAVGGDSKLVLRAASVYGQSFLPEGVKVMLADLSDEDVDSWLDILVRKEILFSRPVGNTRQYVFRHALLQQAAYALLSPGDQISAHYIAGDFLENNGERDAMVLADHYEKGQKPERAIRWLRVAANQAMEVDDLKAALDRVERGVRLGAQGDDLAELRVVESEARYWKGEYVEAERAAREGGSCTDPELRLRAQSALIAALGPQAKYEEIGDIDKALGECPKEPDRFLAWLDCKYNAAAFLAVAGHSKARYEVIELMDSQKERLDSVLLGRLESMRAHVARADDRPVGMVEGFKRASKIFEQAGHRRAGIEALANSGSGLMELAQLEEAEIQTRKVWEVSERMGLHHMDGGIYYLLCNILAYKGDLDEARSFGEMALDYTAKHNDNYFRSFALLYLSLVHYLACDFGKSEARAREGLVAVDGNPALEPFANALIARALLRQGMVVEALHLAEHAHAGLETVGTVQDGEATIRLAYAECLLAVSRRQDARIVLAKAIDRLRGKARTIESPEWRRSFLLRIPEHKGIVELAESVELVSDEDLDAI
jgi:serine/threonine protein kinase/tetratricopeptide (TPR) repeat protein